jgi:protocatechuate 3,4-dioxygenase beta subunit
VTAGSLIARSAALPGDRTYRRRMRPSRAAVVVAALLLGLLVVVPAPSGATGTPAAREAAAVTGLHGTVTDPRGRPIAGARVLLSLVGSHSVGITVRTNAAGDWVKRLEPGRYDVSFDGPDFSTYLPEHAGTVLVRAGRLARVDRVMSDGSVVSGRVVDRVGEPLDATVRLGWRNGTGWSFGDPLPTGADGRFAFTAVPEGRFRVTATAPGRVPTTWPGGYTAAEGRDVVTADDVDPSLGDLVVPLPSSLSGSAVNGEDPTTEVRYTVARLGSPVETRESAPGGEGGRFTADGLAPGRYVVWFDSGGIREFWEDAATAGSSTVVEVGVEQDAVIGASQLRSARVAGDLRTASGSAVPRATVLLERWTGRAWEPAGSATTDTEGRYESDPLVPGRYRVSFYEPSDSTLAAPVEVVVRQGATTRVDLRARDLGVLAGRVTDASGAAVEGAALQVYVARGATFRRALVPPVGLDADGSYRIELPDDRYRLGLLLRPGDTFPVTFIGSPSLPGRDGRPDVLGGLVVRSGTTVRTDLLLRRPGSISGLVTDADGEPVAGALVHPVSTDPDVHAPGAVTDEAGRYVVDGVYPGSYLLQASADGFLAEVHPDAVLSYGEFDVLDPPAAAVPVVVAPGEETAGRGFELARPSSVTVSLTTDGPEPLLSEVTLFRWEEDHWTSRTAGGPDASFGGLVRGTYRLGYSAVLDDRGIVTVGHGPRGPQGPPDDDALVLEVGAEQDLAVRRQLSSAGTISGTVQRGAGGTMSVEEQVGSQWRTVSREAVHPAFTSGLTVFATGALAPGRYRLSYDGEGRLPATWTVDHGTRATRVDLEVASGPVTRAVISGRTLFPDRPDVVQAVRPDGSVAASVVAAGDEFELVVAPGRYAVRFRDPSGAAADHFLGEAFPVIPLAGARFIDVRGDTEVEVRGGAARGAVLHGRVVPRPRSTATRWTRVEVLARRAGRWSVVGGQSVDSRGFWRVYGLRPGDYRLRFTRDVGFPRSPDVQVDGGCLPAQGRVVRMTSGARAVVDAGTTSLVPMPEYGTGLARAPVVSGPARAGRVLTVSHGSWLPCQVRLTRQWLRDGVEVSGAVGPRYRLTARDVGHRMSVRVVATPQGPSASGRAPLQVVTGATPRVRR